MSIPYPSTPPKQRAAGIIVASVLLVALAAVGSTAAFAQMPTSGGVLDSVATDYRGAYFGWLDRLIPIAQRTFVLLAGIEFVISGAIWMLRGDDLDEAVGQFILKFAFLAFAFALIFSFEFWVPEIINGFIRAGQIGANEGLITPSLVLDIGDRVYMEMADATRSLSVIVNPVSVLTIGIAATLTALCYVGVAVQLVLVLIESYLVLGAGVVFLGFAGFRGTASFAENYLLYAFHIGIKLFLIHLLVGLGATLSQAWAFYLRGTAGPLNMAPVFEVLAGSVVFVLVVVVLPRSFARGITGGASLGLANAVRAGH